VLIFLFAISLIQMQYLHHPYLVSSPSSRHTNYCAKVSLSLKWEDLILNIAYLSHLSVKYVKIETVVLGIASRKPSRVIIQCFITRRRSQYDFAAVYRQVTVLYRQCWENELYWIVAIRSHHRPQHDYEGRAAQLAV
jgi:hypothetical protein